MTSPPLRLLGVHEPDAVVAFGASGTKTAAELLADAAQVSRALPPASAGSHVLLSFEGDRYEMAVALLGALDRGHAVALPPSTRQDAIAAVRSRPEMVAFLHDTEGGFPRKLSELLADKDPGTALPAPIVPHAGVIATVFTSGTTGPMTAWPKTSSELLGEALALGEAFSIRPGDRIVGTVAPGHIYGLLFTILTPLLCGAAFSRETPHHAEAVARCVREHAAGVLVTVPVQLRALAALEPGSLAGLRRVFSSTGPLPDSVVREFYECHRLPVTEVLGSTETGGIASRNRVGHAEESWRPFDSVRISVGRGGRLRVDSPFLHEDLPRPFETADLVEVHADGSFVHLGRADGIVKIGGRRVSIREVEDCIRQQPGVEDVTVVAVPAQAARGQQLLAAVSPSSCNVAALKKALLKRFEPTCLPRRILAVETLPLESNGKTRRERILRLFGLRPDGHPFRWTLEWNEPTRTHHAGGERFEFGVRLPPDYGWFEGHFDGFPLLAGAVQLKELILPAVARACPDLGSLKSMIRIKFTGRITQENLLIVRVERRARRGRVDFEIWHGEELCSHGALLFDEAADR